MSREKHDHLEFCKSCGMIHAVNPGKKTQPQSHPAPIKKLIQADRDFTEIILPRNQANNEAHTKTGYAPFIYSDKPDPLFAFVDRARIFSVALKQAQGHADYQNYLDNCRGRNFFSVPIRGRSIFDIENMELPLSRSDILAISKTVRRHYFSPGLSNEAKVAQGCMMLLPTQSLKSTIPGQRLLVKWEKTYLKKLLIKLWVILEGLKAGRKALLRYKTTLLYLG